MEKHLLKESTWKYVSYEVFWLEHWMEALVCCSILLQFALVLLNTRFLGKYLKYAVAFFPCLYIWLGFEMPFAQNNASEWPYSQHQPPIPHHSLKNCNMCLKISGMPCMVCCELFLLHTLVVSNHKSLMHSGIQSIGLNKKKSILYCEMPYTDLSKNSNSKYSILGMPSVTACR